MRKNGIEFKSFFRRFGDDVANFIIDPMVRGICAGDSREISAAAFILGPLYREGF